MVLLGNYDRKAFCIWKNGEEGQMFFIFPYTVTWSFTFNDIAENTGCGSVHI